MGVLSLDQIRTKLSEFSPELFDVSSETRQAAVAIVLRESNPGLEVLFIKRAEFDGDPWSGHMSFPGGHRDHSDASLRVAAERETFEEIGLSLESATYCGALSHQRTYGRGNRPGMLVAPYVFTIEDDFDEKISSEVEAVVWGPLEAMMNGVLHSTEERPLNTGFSKFSGYTLGKNRFVWGLTYRTLQELFEVIDPSYVQPNESLT